MFVRKTSHFFKKKIKCYNKDKKQNKLNFYFSLSGVPNVRGGWVGSNVWYKVPKKTFFWHLPLSWFTFWFKAGFKFSKSLVEEVNQVEMPQNDKIMYHSYSKTLILGFWYLRPFCLFASETVVVEFFDKDQLSLCIFSWELSNSQPDDWWKRCRALLFWAQFTGKKAQFLSMKKGELRNSQHREK